MKNAVVIIILCLFALPVIGQRFKMTVSAGMSPQQNPTSNHIIVNRSAPEDEFTFDLLQASPVYYVGIGTKYDMAPFFFAADAQYNRREYIYDINSVPSDFSRTVATQQASESMNVINLPLTLGYDLGIVDVTSGFVPQFVISNQTDLDNVEGYSESLDRVRFGWHSGLAVHIRDFRVGLTYQQDFNNYADHINIRDQNLALQGLTSRILGTLSYEF